MRISGHSQLSGYLHIRRIIHRDVKPSLGWTSDAISPFPVVFYEAMELHLPSFLLVVSRAILFESQQQLKLRSARSPTRSRSNVVVSVPRAATACLRSTSRDSMRDSSDLGLFLARFVHQQAPHFER